ncbi:MAG: tRNA (adenosine(37)-N6)-dimethylallyltransferase MiaA [bacterium]|nr:tRNA (adenosine(37)-N6)-dimethylallyltransferase MiaA [bacterium]
MAGDERLPLVVILGPTAVGKTGLALEVAGALNGEIVGADSRQVYRYMDIGTAKPTLEERRQVAHHLVDVINPDDQLSLQRYQTMALNAIRDIQKRDRLPLLVGGTGQYITAIVDGWTIPEVPPNEALRAELETFAKMSGAEALHARLQEIDPEAAQKIHPNNVRRVIRYLEMIYATGGSVASLQRKQPPPYRIYQLGLEMERQALYARSDQRIDQMMALGFLDEVQVLLDKGYSRTLPSMSGLGYAQLASHLLDGTPLHDAVEATKAATRDFIKRQMTWFRGHDSGIVWHNVEQSSPNDLIDMLGAWLEERA